MRLAVLFSGGKDSTHAAWLAKEFGHNISCLISIWSENKDSFMFHTPSIEFTKKQSELMDIPLIVQVTKGKKEVELVDLEKAIRLAKEDFGVEGIVTGAVESVYQATRVQEICNDLGLEVFNPLWQKDQIELLYELVEKKFEVVLTGVAAYPLDKDWIGKKIDKKFILEVKKLQKEFGFNPAGEGGEFETLVVNCPMYKKRLGVKLKRVVGEGNSWRGVWE
jgi:diphthine-ammonia ligase